MGIPLLGGVAWPVKQTTRSRERGRRGAGWSSESQAEGRIRIQQDLRMEKKIKYGSRREKRGHQRRIPLSLHLPFGPKMGARFFPGRTRENGKSEGGGEE